MAPITLDDFNNRKIEAGSSCTQVNTSAAFPVIYLNDISVIPLPSSCQNAIVINGGLPEFDSTLNYIINIYLKDDPSVKGQLENFGGNGDTIFFEVPRPGEYWIEISDQTGCERIFNFEVFNCAALFIDLPQKNVAENSSFCVPIQVRNFTDILSLQFALQWDSLILQYDRINISDPSILPGLNSSGFNIFENSVNFSWDVGTMPEISIPDSSPIFEICFIAIGNLENCTPIEIIEKFDFPLEVVDVSTKSIGLIAPPGEICISNSPLIIQNTIYPVECRGENSGKFMFRIFGGFPPYSFEFENNFYGNIQEGEEIVFSSLQTGNYTLEVEDNVGNQRNISFLIEDGVELEINSEVFSPTCYGGNDGKITTTLLINGKNELPSSGLYSYSWSTGKSDWEQVGLKSGAYQLTVTHQNGCTQRQLFNINEPERLTIDSVVGDSPTCIGFKDGRIFSYLSGGTKPYSYQLIGEGKDIKLPANVFSGLGIGKYELIYSDSLGCEELKDSIEVVDPPGIIMEFSTIQSVSCPQGINDGQATVSAEYEDKKTGTFIFNWLGAGQVDSDVLISRGVNLPSGFQQVVVSDKNGCSAIDSIFIPSPDPIFITTDFEIPSCHDSKDGSITVNPFGGTPGYSITWLHSGAQDFTAKDLGIGSYTVEIFDAKGCEQKEDIFLSGPAELELMVDLNNTNDVSCFGGKDGQLTVMYNSGDPINSIGNSPYEWSDGVGNNSNPVISGLAAGTYRVTLTDIKGCKDSLEFSIQEPLPIEADIEITQPALCFGDPSVLEVKNILGGNGNYKFSITGSSLMYESNQKAYVFEGNYDLTVTDKMGCFYKENFEVEGPDSFSVEFNPQKIIIELGDQSKRLIPLILNSTPIANYQWSPAIGLSDISIEQPFFTGIEDQKYELLVTDVNGCEATGSILVEVNKARKVYLPNVFSPNGDGINDEFVLYGCEGIQSVNQFLLFDRWGDLLHKIDQFNAPDCLNGIPIWNGKRGNQNLSEGSYVYALEITFIDGITLTFKGELTLMQ